MKKRIVALLLVVNLLLLTSCTAIKNLGEFANDVKYLFSSMSKSHDYNVDAALSYDFDESIKDQIEERFEKMNEILEGDNNLRAVTFMMLYAQQLSDIYYVADQANLAFIAFSKNTEDQKISDDYEYLNNLFTDYSTRLTKMYRTIYESSLKNTFYNSWPEEEIEKALFMSDTSSEEFVNLKKQVDAEIQRYQSMDQGSSNFLSHSADAYYSIVHKNMEIAKIAGYDNYVDYAYEYVYGRDYAPEDAQKMYDYVRSYIVPLGNSILKSLSRYGKLNSVINEMTKLTGDSTNPENIPEILEPYYEKLGGEFPAAFEKWQSNYHTSSDTRGLPNAYTVFLNYYQNPVCFYGPGCQDLFTYVHEQGHFNAFSISEASIESIDLCEVHSQGNEWLYLSYISDNYSTEYFNNIASYYLFDSICTIVLATCCDAFEQYVYTHPNLKTADYDEVFVNVAKDMGAYEFLKGSLSIEPEDYWHYAIVANSVYYLSYAVSKIPSIELYVIAMEEGFEKAAEKYTALTHVDASAEFISTLTESGLDSPFESKPYERIRNYFQGTIN